MSKLIQELKAEHQELSEIFQSIIKFGITSDKGLNLLNRSKELLLEHLKKEDERLYPPLREKAKTDILLKRTLNAYDEELEAVTNTVMNFYKKYSRINDINKKEFIDDISKINVAFKNRVMKEEVLLYPTFNKFYRN